MMRMPARETGSVVVRARKDEVLEVLRRFEGAAQTAPDRVTARESTYVLRDAEGGTQVILARRGELPVTLTRQPREELRREVESDLFRLQRLFEVKARSP